MITDIKENAYQSLYIIFLSSLSKSDVENGYLNSPSSKNALFVFLPQNEMESRLVICTSIFLSLVSFLIMLCIGCYLSPVFVLIVVYLQYLYFSNAKSPMSKLRERIKKSNGDQESSNVSYFRLSFASPTASPTVHVSMYCVW